MYSIRYGADVTLDTVDLETAREALEAVEEYIAAKRSHVGVTETATLRNVDLVELRELSAAEIQAEVDGPFRHPRSSPFEILRLPLPLALHKGAHGMASFPC